MRVTIISGGHPRHRYLLEPALSLFDDIQLIQMSRESLIPDSSNIEDRHIKKIYEYHFNDRYIKERAEFGTQTMLDLLGNTLNNVLSVDKESINSRVVKDAVESFNPDHCIVMGSTVLDDEFLKIIPKHSINIHLGLSPWYRGSATLFWPTYNLEPWKCGVTFHKLSSLVDGGEIYLQTGVKIEANQGCVDTSISAIILARQSVAGLMKAIISNGDNIGTVKQKITGRSYLYSQFRPEHLLAIYDYFDNKVAKKLLEVYKNKIPEVKLVNAINIK